MSCSKLKYFYEAFGFTIGSEMRLPELPPSRRGSGIVQVSIAMGAVEACNAVRMDTYSVISEDKAYLQWDRIARFSVSNGEKITIEPFAGAPEQLVRIPLLGTVMAVLLFQRGLLVLHGSAMRIGRVSASFLGSKGVGKSTLAAALHSRGCGLLADDLVAIQIDNAHSPSALPAYPQLKLWPDAASMTLGRKARKMRSLHPLLDKGMHAVEEGFCHYSVPLRHVYFLSAGESIEIQPVPQRQSLMKLIRNSYILRSVTNSNPNLEGSHLVNCSALLKSVSCFDLSYPSDLARVPEIVKLIEEHVNMTNWISGSCSVM